MASSDCCLYATRHIDLFINVAIRPGADSLGSIESFPVVNEHTVSDMAHVYQQQHVANLWLLLLFVY